LARNFQPDSEWYVFESQVRELYGRVAYTHKTHEKMAEKKAALQSHIKIAQIVLSAIATSGAIGVIVTNDASAKIVTALFTVATLAVSTYVKDIDPGALAQKHRQTASDLWNIREAYLSLLTDLRDESKSLEGLKGLRDVLQAHLHEIYKLAPNTDGDAYAKAQKALKHNEDLMFSDGEIDAFLPGPLKRAANQ
jgi:hypothetical protein